MAVKNGNEEKVKDKAKARGLSRVAKPFAFAVVLVLASFIILYFISSHYAPFSTFKYNFLNSPNVSIVVMYSNESQFEAEYSCITLLPQHIKFKNLNGFRLFIINVSNNTCIFSTGIVPNITKRNSSYCLSIANSEPSIFLEYSEQNSTSISSDKLVIKGNSAYMAACPVAVDMS